MPEPMSANPATLTDEELQARFDELAGLSMRTMAHVSQMLDIKCEQLRRVQERSDDLESKRIELENVAFFGARVVAWATSINWSSKQTNSKAWLERLRQLIVEHTKVYDQAIGSDGRILLETIPERIWE